MTEFDADHEQIRATIADLFDHYASLAATRGVMTLQPGYDRGLFARLSDELGLGMLLVPESLGGLGLGATAAAIVVSEAARRLVPGPLIDTLAVACVLAAVRSERSHGLLRQIAAGSYLAVASAPVHSDMHGGPSVEGDRAELRVEPAGSDDGDTGYTVTGVGRAVMYGADVDAVVVAAPGPDGPALYSVQATDVAGRCTRHMTLDQTRWLATIDFAHTRAIRLSTSASGQRDCDVLGAIRQLLLAVESVAAAQACLDITVEYLKTRQQFGKPLGSFQALKHRCADHVVRLYGARATAWAAVAPAESAVTGGAHPSLATEAAVARLVAADAFWEIAADSIQLHGGIGFTFEHDSHLYLKRAKANQLLLGGLAHPRAAVGEAIGL